MNRFFLTKIDFLLTKKDKKTLILLFFMTIILSIIETIGITAIMPFISTASNPNLIFSNEYYKEVYDFFGFTNSRNFIVYFGISLIIFYILRAFYIILHSYLMSSFSMIKYKEFTTKLYANYINMPYKTFVIKNSATLSKVIVVEALQLSYMVQNILLFLSEIIIVVILYVLLLLVDINMTLILTVIMGIKVLVLTQTISKKIKLIGIQRAVIQEKFNRIINESFGNFKVIKFISNHSQLERAFGKISNDFANIQISNVTLSIIPKNALESIGLSILMLVVVYIVAYKDDVNEVIPIVSMYALALYRLLPATTRILNSYNSIIFYLPSLDLIYNDIVHEYIEEIEKEKILFEDVIKLKDISFRYTQNNIINNLSLSIKKGQSIAFIGESGSGKSTLVDLICGIYRPDSGKIFIDNVELDNTNIVSWRKKIGYIPQSIYLFDGTIAENISFGRDYNEKKIIKVLKQANIYNTLVKKDGLNTMVGEGGIQLSGGQKQRIGIARALYGNPEVLVLDEATSALDTITEQAIMNEIYNISKDKTLMIIAHRLSTIERCDIQIDVSKINKKLKE